MPATDAAAHGQLADMDNPDNYGAIKDTGFWEQQLGRRGADWLLASISQWSSARVISRICRSVF